MEGDPHQRHQVLEVGMEDRRPITLAAGKDLGRVVQVVHVVIGPGAAEGGPVEDTAERERQQGGPGGEAGQRELPRGGGGEAGRRLWLERRHGASGGATRGAAGATSAGGSPGPGLRASR